MYQAPPAIGGMLFKLAAALFIGYLYGWFANESSEARAVCFVIGILLLLIMKIARSMHANDIIARSQMAAAHEDTQAENLKQQLEVMKAQATANQQYEFTSDDFEADARVIMNAVIHKARGRDKKARITGAALVSTFMKNLH